MSRIIRPEPRAGLATRREVLVGAAALGLAAAALLPGAARAQETPQKGGMLRVGLADGSTTDTLDPQTYTGAFMLCLGFATHSTLTELSPEGELVGDAAEGWEASKDAATWTFKLRKGVTFSDGKPMTAEDVIGSLAYHGGEDSKSGAKEILDRIAEMKQDGDDAIVFKLAGGNADFAYLMADYHLLIMPLKDGKPDWQGYVGTGGYVLESFEPGVRAALKRNPNYWKENRAHLDEVEIIGIADAAARQNALITGEVDLINRCDLKTVQLLARAPGLRIEEATGLLHYTAPMITTSSPYDDNELRLAIKHGIDREELLTKVLSGYGALANDNPIAPSIPFWADLEQRTYDPDKARHHLKRSGYDNVALDLSAADAAYGGAVDAAVLMQEQLARAGVKVNVVREPNDGYWSNVWMKKPWCAAYWGGRPTCDWMFSQAYATGANWNDTAWSNERFDELLLEGRTELDPALRGEIYHEMQEIVRDDGGAVIWAFANYVDGMADKVRHGPAVAANWELDGGRFAERWWVTE